MSQVKISGNASGTGVLTIAAPNTNTDRSITIPDKAGAIAVGAGTIVQVVTGTTNTQAQTTSSTYIDSGLTASITPTSSSNKVLVMISQHCVWGRSVSGQGGGVQLLRGSTVIWRPAVDNTGPFIDYLSDVRDHYFFFNLTYLDSPATTSSTTYKTQGRPHQTSNSGSFTMQPAPGSGSDDPTTSIITLMEVVA